MINYKVKQAVASGDVQQTRTDLLMITLLDRGFYGNDFDESLKYASENLVGLFDKFDNEEEKPENDWTEDYWNYIYASLMDNFCTERIELIKKVGRKVYPPVAKATVSPTVQPSPRRIDALHTQRGIPTSIKVGGTIAIAALGCATIGVAKTALAAAVIVGGAIALQKKELR